MSVLIEAIKAKESIEKIKLLLDTDADPNIKNKNGETPLEQSKRRCNKSVRTLWEHQLKQRAS